MAGIFEKGAAQGWFLQEQNQIVEAYLLAEN